MPAFTSPSDEPESSGASSGPMFQPVFEAAPPMHWARASKASAG